MSGILITALLYFAAVFAAGILLGTIRVPFLEPRLGAFAATLCEAPFLVIAMVIAARRAPALAGLAAGGTALVLVGLVALVLQQLAEFAFGLTLRRKSLRELLVHFTTPEGIIYVLLLVLFAAMPWLVHRAGR